MINKLMKGFVDLVYGTGRIRRKFQLDNPTEKVLASDGCKGIVDSTNKDIQRGFDWVTSQRAVIILTNRRIVCGKWTIDLENIERSDLVKINSVFGEGMVLKIQTRDGKNYQFGMQMNPEWTNQEVLPMTLEKGSIKYSSFSIFMRIAVVVIILYWLYTTLFK